MSLEVFEHVCETYSETDEGLMSNHQILNLHVGVQSGFGPFKIIDPERVNYNLQVNIMCS